MVSVYCSLTQLWRVHARHLYERVGFRQLGVIPGGFRLKNGEYEDICPYYIELINTVDK